jgi:chromosome segregation protein
MLKSIEIQGFKSFPDKTVLDFPEGITAMVGPNGSGKSNIVDAIRWVLGEQSSKNIRINNGADVIFSGTPSRPASAFASIGVNFDNRHSVFPIEYSEVLITRKVYRDGNSEYFLNKKQVRLKDVTQLLAGAKLGVKGMSIINQGAGDVFLRANPMERREMIEEMVGLKEYRIKKEEAERKIKETKDNLVRVQTLVAEMEPNLHSLKRQVSRWQSRAAKETELKTNEEKYFLNKFHELENIFSAQQFSPPQTKELRSRAEAMEKEINELTHQIKTLEVQDPELLIQKDKLSKLVNDLREQKTEISRRLGNIEGQLEAWQRAQQKQELIPLASVRSSLTEAIDCLENIQEENNLSRVKEVIKQALAVLSRLLQEKNPVLENDSQELELGQSKQKDTQELAQVVKALQESEKQLQEVSRRLSSQSDDQRQAYKNLEDQRVKLREIEAKLESVRFLEEKRKIKEEDLRLKLEEAGWDYALMEKQYQEQSNKPDFIPFAEEELRQLEIKIIRLRRDLGAIGEIDSSIIKEYEEINQRHEFLALQEKDLSAALLDWEKLNQSLEEKISLGFKAALVKIDKEFDRYFGLIFDGGKASLRLTQAQTQEIQVEENEKAAAITEAGPASESRQVSRDLDQTAPELGIEFSVHVPRKKIRSLEMLSGGEKSLTAIALLFAIIAYARPPFLVLDEIDAALDERNSGKVAALLRDLANQVQFVLITHNRSIMESAKVLYGITMDDGVSRVFSLRFAEAEEMAKQDIHQNN